MKLEVYDQDPVADDTIGKTSIPLGGVISSQVVDAWYTIGKGSSSTGEIRVMLRFKPVKTMERFLQDLIQMQLKLFNLIQVAAGVAGGALAAAALGYGAKMAYDHYNKKSDQANNMAVNLRVVMEVSLNIIMEIRLMVGNLKEVMAASLKEVPVSLRAVMAINKATDNIIILVTLTVVTKVNSFREDL
ncbi:Extended synaptotagmin-1 [Massospora cicadina]|nr:Extended synaptotagmin-1 [Massospora cicadina]